MAGIFGGAVYTHRGFEYISSADFINCTIINNEALEYGGAFYCADYEGNITIENSILWNNTADLGANGISADYTEIIINNSIMDAENCEDFVFDNMDGLILSCDSSNIYNISPELIDTTAFISCTSPAINAGNNDLFEMDFLPFGDLDSNSRIFNNIIDIGAYEFGFLPIEINTEITNASTVNSTDGEIEIMEIVGGIPPYQISWEDGDSTELLSNLIHGIYELTISDSMGCERNFEIEVSFNSNIEELSELKNNLIIYPNPTKNQIFITPIHALKGSGKLLFQNLSGQTIFEKSIANLETIGKIELPDLAAGLYLIQLKNEWRIVSGKVVIQ